jgi:pimeloyl-ACP methyl ester carboxylesterase
VHGTFWAVGGQQPGYQGPVTEVYSSFAGCPPALNAHGSPSVVAVLVSGVKTSLAPHNPYMPLNQHYCVADDPEGAPGSKSTVYANFHSTWPARNTDLVRFIEENGGLVLPFSYGGNGVSLSGKNLSAKASIAKYSASEVGNTAPDDAFGAPEKRTAAYRLDEELASVHNAWKDSKIIVIGHSEGGLVAERWWQDYGVRDGGRLGVTNVYSLDSPINGFPENICLVKVASYDLCQSLSVQSSLAEYWTKLWTNMDTNDPVVLVLDQPAPVPHTAYTAVGTSNDQVYAQTWSAPLVSQMIFDQRSDCSDVNCSLYSPPDVENTTCNRGLGLNPRNWLDDIENSHGQVMNCPAVQKLLVPQLPAAY